MKTQNPIFEYMHSLTLLCVEDSSSIRTIYKLFLQDYFDTIYFAEDGAKGLELFEKHKIDIIITDNDMPNLTGIEMIAKIRQKSKEIPIILVTALDEKDLIIRALQLNVTDFLKKPIEKKNLLRTLEDISKGIYASALLKEEQERKLRHLQERYEYTTYQEKLAFLKELNILRNDLYYQVLTQKRKDQLIFIDIFYKPLDTVSGDAYSIRKFGDTKFLYFIVDGMGKGLSASQSAILLTSHINYFIDKYKDCSLNSLIDDLLEFIRPILLEDETISLDLFLFDYENEQLEYAKFAMPASLAQTKELDIIPIKSNNPPISKYSYGFKTSKLDIALFEKFLFFSDGIVENPTIYPGKNYIDFIEDDFFTSFSKEEIKAHFYSKITKQEDDITIMFINKIAIKDKLYASKSFPALLTHVEKATQWFMQQCSSLVNNDVMLNKLEVTFSELFMNAYEHGNLSLGAKKKHQLLEEDIYFETLALKEQECIENIDVAIYKIDYMTSRYLLTAIQDKGEGFDTKRLSRIFREMQHYNGRGIYMSKRSSLGIYYTEKGNSVYFLFKI